MKRNRIIYMPYPYWGAQKNEITSNMVNILSENYEVVDRMDPSLNLLSILETKAIILNWSEQYITEEQKKQILQYQKYGTKIIWFFHNRIAHEPENADKERSNMLWFADNSDYIAVLSRSSKQYVPGQEKNRDKVRYVPHVKYYSRKNERITQALRNKYHINKDELVYCAFGWIRPYKNIETAIQCFNEISNEKVRLIIAGKPITEEYGNEIRELAAGNKKIITEFKFLSELELDAIIDLSDVVLMTYGGVSSMNSGVLIKALCEGKAVITPNICMANDISEKSDFLYIWQSGNAEMLKEQILQAYKDGKEVLQMKGNRAQKYIEDHNSNEIVKRALEDILNEENGKLQTDIPKEVSLESNLLEKEVESYNKNYRKYMYLFNITCQWMHIKNRKIEISDWINSVGWKRIAIYGMGGIGKVLLEELKNSDIDVAYGIDKQGDDIYIDIPVYRITDHLEAVDGIIVTAVTYFDEVKKEVQNHINTPIVSIKDILDELDIV